MPRSNRPASGAELDRICETALEIAQNSQEFSDFIKLMAFSGGRWGETLRLRWSDVNWTQRQLTFGSDGLSKSHRQREVDFNPKLEGHLKEMAAHRQPDSIYVFPSPLRGDADRPCQTFAWTLDRVRKATGLSNFHAHLCRHFFASQAVMNGIDFATVASWLGHADGGILVGKTYGHLADEHKTRMAAKVNFGPVVLADAETG